jgi:two-component system sensor histidine kinase MtrB
VLTVSLGTVVVVAIGQLVLYDVANGLVEQRTRVAFAESAAQAARAQEAFDQAPAQDVAAEQQLVDDLLPRLEGAGAQRLREVVLLRSEGNERAVTLREPFSDGILPSTVTTELRDAVAADPQRQQAQLLEVRSAGPDDGDPAIAVGSRVELPLSGEHDLYLVYRLDQEQQSLAVVERALLLGQVALVLLVGAIAWLVTRLVVEPVREAAGTAQRLAGGQLDVRMAERGEDDLALLSRSFNAMASSLQRQIGQLEQLSQLQQRFVSDVSHELRTPLTTIRMAADLLHDRRHEFDAPTARSVELLQAQIDRFEVLLADLLEVSRFDAGAAELDTEAVDVVQEVRRSAETAQPIADARGVRLEVRGPAQPVMAQVDRRRVARVVRNLVTNAVEHAEGSDVTVTVAADAQAVAVGVRDHGVGLDPAELARVFDRFWRADPARARTTGGTGLGLAISLEDTLLHGGRLEVWGAPGQGAHFVMTVPRRAGADPGRGPLAVGPQPAPGPAPQTATGPEQPRDPEPQPAPGTVRAAEPAAPAVPTPPAAAGTTRPAPPAPDGSRPDGAQVLR